MAFFVYGGQVFEGSGGAFPVRGSTVVLAFENGRQIADPKGLRDSDALFFGDLVNQAAKKKDQMMSSGKSR